MHKVCNIRDLDLRAKLPADKKWEAYRVDLENLISRAIDGGFASVHSSSSDFKREAA